MKNRTKIKIIEKTLGGFTAAEGVVVELKYDEKCYLSLNTSS